MSAMYRSVLLNERIYDRERAEELAWQSVRGAGVSRRHLLRFLAGGAAAAAMARLVPSHSELVAAQADGAIVKPAPPELFVRSDSNLEMRWEAMYHRGYLVPNELFFVRNNSPVVPRLEPATWRLHVGGSGVSRPRSFTYDEILSMPSMAVPPRDRVRRQRQRTLSDVPREEDLLGRRGGWAGSAWPNGRACPCEKCWSGPESNRLPVTSCLRAWTRSE